jgi:hypothetical protein
MSLLTVEGIVVNGRIQLPEGVELPERAKVYVVVPDVAVPPARIFSPRLARPADAADFAKQVIEAPANAGKPTAQQA